MGRILKGLSRRNIALNLHFVNLDHCDKLNSICITDLRVYGYIFIHDKTYRKYHRPFKRRRKSTGIFLYLNVCLGHDLIFQKLELLGVPGPAKGWFSRYLEGCSQFVELIQNQVSGGVPQGSVYGPVLFIHFTNDLGQYLRTYTNNNRVTLMYTDDMTLLFNSPSSKDLVVNAYAALDK